MKTINRLVCLALLFLTSGLFAAKNKSVEPVEIAVNTPDSLELVGYLYLPTQRLNYLPPAVILLHDASKNHEDWDNFARVLCDQGMAAFAMDLRGYGYSIFDLKTRKNRPTNTFYPKDFERYPGDIRQIVGELCRLYCKQVDTTKLAVIGSALGGNAGLIYAFDEPRVKFTALISPGLDYKGLRIAPFIKKYGERPLYLVGAEKDLYTAESINMISDIVPRVLDIEIFPGYYSANMLIDNTPQLVQNLVDRLKKHLF